MGGQCSHRKQHAGFSVPASFMGSGERSVTGDHPSADDEDQGVDEHSVADDRDGDDADAAPAADDENAADDGGPPIVLQVYDSGYGMFATQDIRR